jgi:hypothetical protein
MKLVAIVLGTILVTASASNADPEIGSDRKHSKVRLSESQETRPSTSTVSQEDGSKQKREVLECDQGPGARAAGLSCEISEFPGTFGDPVEPDVDPGDIERAIREVPMPPLTLHVQPDGRTLVNVETIFYTEPTTMRRTVALLGHSVRLECTPVRYTWVHGDGTTASTGKPGRPYPAKDVTHRYQRPGSDLRARVDTTYSVRYSVDGGRWTDLAEPLTAPGPSTAIDVDEAVPVLTH